VSDVPNELIQAYESTSFGAQTPDPVVIRVREICQPLDGLLGKVGLETWAFITASNPESNQLSDEDNAARNNQLLEDIHAYQPHVYPGEGVPDNPGWSPEASLLILGIDRESAIQLGRKYGQNAIVYGTKGEPAQLIFCLS
jgi:hypothetical protein